MLLFFYSSHSSSLQNLVLSITHNATQPLSDISGGKLFDYVQSSLEPLNTFFSTHVYTNVYNVLCNPWRLKEGLKIPYRTCLQDLEAELVEFKVNAHAHASHYFPVRLLDIISFI